MRTSSQTAWPPAPRKQTTSLNVCPASFDTCHFCSTVPGFVQVGVHEPGAAGLAILTQDRVGISDHAIEIDQKDADRRGFCHRPKLGFPFMHFLLDQNPSRALLICPCRTSNSAPSQFPNSNTIQAQLPLALEKRLDNQRIRPVARKKLCRRQLPGRYHRSLRSKLDPLVIAVPPCALAGSLWVERIGI